MDILPEFDLPQVQTILNALKNICRDYPAGGSVLRELLQNADDAQASEVKFFLDENSYETENLHPKLSQYQGPALLAYNNAEFKKEHFQSLSQVGNSLKMNDGSTTGKFGRGFNSVYNWTDSPSIVSGHRVQILDPHHSWSSGGNGYNFVEHSENPSLKAHMTVYQSLMKSVKQPFPGTIIRLPLRTAEQAKESGISDRKITVQEMAHVLNKFTEDFGKEGLLFMKHVLKLSVISTITGLIEVEVVNTEAVQVNKSRINDAIINTLKNPFQDFDCSFEMELRYKTRTTTTEMRFLLHHSIQGNSMSEEIRKWSIAQKSLPWVAVAVPLCAPKVPAINGSLFLVMPLHIPINQPALIHGLFSISPDRARLYKSQDHSSQDQLPAQWNQYLFNSPIPRAWTKLLGHLALSPPPDPAFKYWPRKSDDPDNLSKNVLTQVLSLIGNQPVWHTVNGYVGADSGLLATGNEPQSLKLTLANAKIPVVYLPDKLRVEAKETFSNLTLEPRTLCTYLRDKNDLVASWPQATRQEILEYILPILDSSDLIKGLALFPFEDGTCRAIDDHLAFVHRDDFEAELFRRDPKHNLDLKQFSRPILNNLQDRLRTLEVRPHIRHRSASDFKKYAMTYFFHEVHDDADVTALDLNQISFVTKTWKWIRRNSSVQNDSIASLWLLPLANGKYRKIKPNNCWAIIPPPGQLGDTIQKLGKDVAAQHTPVVLSGRSGLDTVLVELLKTTKAGSTLQVRNGEMFHVVLEWLAESHVAIENASDGDKTVIIENIARAIKGKLDSKYTNSNSLNLQHLQQLPIFQELTCGNDGGCQYPWVRIETFKSQIGVIDKMFPLPKFRDYQFLDAQTIPIQEILSYQNLCVCKSKIGVLEDHIIPAWRKPQKCTWSPSLKEQTAELMLQCYADLSAQAQAAMISLPIVPTQCIDGTLTGRFSTASALVDPENKWLKSVFFSGEEVLPADKPFARYGHIFRKLRLRTEADELFIYERICKFVSSSQLVDREEIHSCAKSLLKTTCSWSPSEATATNYKQFLNRKWLPANFPDGTIDMVSPNQCRGIEDRLRAGSRLPIVSFTITYRWQKFLGWDTILHDDILLAQLNHGIINDDRAVVNAVLTYFKEKIRIDAVSDSLKELRSVLTENGTFVTASKAFFSGCALLGPFLGNIDAGFAKMHEDILKAMNVGLRPAVKDILDVQAQIERSGHPYKDSDIEILLETIKMASRFSRKSLGGLKVLDQDGVLCPLEDIAYNDAALLSDRIVDKVRFTNSRISQQTAQNLSIEKISERLKKGELQLADDDDDDEDFQQCESITTSISTTLDRYPIESTFKEYLANADDAKASVVNWMLDPRQHPTDNLLTEEMKDLQGPALLVHNDAVFRDIDFNGFKNVGLGSKQEDKSAIGMFGRGSQTMFHFTDNPTLLSGDYLLILDPLQTCLPLNSNWQARKPGVKILLSKLKQLHPNQLVPFHDLWGYNIESDNYDGTIFRFPLRKHTSPLRAKQEPLGISSVRLLLNQYFTQARISLLFLKGVKVVNFMGPGTKELFWSVKMKKNSTSDYTICFAKQMVGTEILVTKDEWWVHSRIEETPSVEFQSRIRKNLEYGVAALVVSESKQDTKNLDLPTPMLFSTLPLPEESTLPVHIHATFSLSGDRSTLITGGESSEACGSTWNSWLLEEKLPNAYLSFLEGLTEKIGLDAFRFWPPKESRRLELLCKSFWEKLPNSSARLFPRRAENPDAANMTMSQTVFDFLLPKFSKQISPVLEVLEPNISPHFPARMLANIKSVAVIKSMDRPDLRELLKSKRASELLQKAMVNDDLLIRNVLNEVIPVGDVSSDDLKKLAGCRLLPLADGTLGQLTLIQSPMPQNTRCYYVVTNSELKLFDFAKSVLILKPEIDAYHRIGEIVKTKMFNVMNLEVTHIPEVLSMKSQGSRVVNDETDEWLKSFWDYWNKFSSSAADNLSKDPESFCSLPLFKAICNGAWEYYTMSELGTLPAIIEPSKTSHQRLCDCIAGLYRFRPEFMPKSTANNEKSFVSYKALSRFIDALRVLESNKSSIKKGLFTRLVAQEQDIVKLQELVIQYVVTGHQDKRHYLPSLPIWPAYMPLSSSEKYIPASGAKYTKQPEFLAPWSKRLPDFIDFKAIDKYGAEACLKEMNVTPIAAIELIQMLDEKDFPSTLQPIGADTYVRFLKALIKILVLEEHNSPLFKTLTSFPLAADTTGKMHRTLELFDHDDEIFKAAFQHDKSKFLHDCGREATWLWNKIGFRRRESNGFLKIDDYQECLLSLIKLLKSMKYGTLVDPTSSIHERMKTILSPLVTPGSATHQFTDTDWDRIAAMSVFLVRKDNSREPSYRRENMDRISECDPTISLSDLVLHEHAAICWSSNPFAVLEPTSEILSKVPRRGEPSIGEVWNHLLHMVEISKNILRADIPDFLSDLWEIYDHLQKHLARSKEYFENYGPTLNRANLWLNPQGVDANTITLGDLRSSWKPINHLLLISSTDAPPFECIRPCLSPYEKLLKELGCESIHHPTIERSAPQLAPPLISTLRAFRKNNEMIDIVLISENTRFSAHKVVLACASHYMKAALSGRWTHNGEITIEEMKPDVLKILIDTAYEELINWDEMKVDQKQSDPAHNANDKKLDLLLDLHKGADYWLMPSLANEVEGRILDQSRFFIRLDNVVEFQEKARDSNARRLEEWCKVFCERNAKALKGWEDSVFS
ncbi:508c04aa-b6c3-4f8a-8734-1eab8d836bb5 [Sclerotinia trifoliorum]|uniref:508c04aa-b6c3-4f8a-8734-1eab8d836bb5 n=1 Tax=Sclerotinia trifoliorum TaxID=28548 RepID=A0A8H2W1K8_9HELO|nr:508c04aa-b6c3-4f8a-8734-1eab8d836bb5 [Sclerotinia trifoliorum]